MWSEHLFSNRKYIVYTLLLQKLSYSYFELSSLTGVPIRVFVFLTTIEKFAVL